ncbi:MAG TPA: L-threonylcarbamoyladenylate synthase [Mycobacteriales bacterium]|nr:L-threonylcarbamoyladenylate synthase [Mycobacteriales bacterium]
MNLVYDCSDDMEREAGIKVAASAVRRGALVVMPTDTVYGIGADAFSPEAVGKLLRAKGRGRDMPVPVLVASRDALYAVADRLPEEARQLVDAFWPGALTLVLRHTPHLAWDLGDARGTVAVRMPDHPIALDVLRETGPMAVSSANRSGMPAALDAEQAQKELGDSVDVYLDGGPCAGSEPSTIVDVTGGTPRVLRRGAISTERLREVLWVHDDEDPPVEA